MNQSAEVLARLWIYLSSLIFYLAVLRAELIELDNFTENEE